MPAAIIQPGEEFDKWTVIRRIANDKQGHRMYLCRCKCGAEHAVEGGNLRRGLSTQCAKCPRQSQDDKLTDIQDAVDSSTEDCILWKWGTDNGYGKIWIDGKQFRVPRLVLERKLGYSLGKLGTRHSCHNPGCINPRHLSAGTQQDNMNDKVAANRQAKGETHGRAKLTDSDVQEIRKLLAEGVMGTEIAERLGVTKSTISAIKTGKSRVYSGSETGSLK